MKTLCLVIVLLFSSLSYAESGLIKIKSNKSVKETIDKLENKLKAKGMTIFSRIKHHEGAKNVGLDLRETELLIFGNPKVGTKLMHCSQFLAIDLPLKFLSWKDKRGQVWLGHNDPSYISKRHKIKKCAKPIILKMSKILKGLAIGVARDKWK